MAASASAAQRRNDSLKPPSALLLLSEGRALHEFASTVALAPLLRLAPRGDGHPVLALPGFLAGDVSTWLMRRYLRELGYRAEGWELGRNVAGFYRTRSVLRARLARLRNETGRKVSLVGWSLGGVFARDLALTMPEAVRSVITLGSPFARELQATNARKVYEQVTGEKTSDARAEDLAAIGGDLPVPATSIYTKTDGVVNWRCSVGREGPMAENIEIVFASHIGLGGNPAALWAIADRLAQKEGEFKPFARSGPFMLAYGKLTSAAKETRAMSGRGPKLTSVDGAFLYLETPETPMHVGSMAIFKLPPDYRGDFFEDFKAQIAARLHLAPMLKWKLARMPLDIDNPTWVEDEQFDLDRHIFRGALPAPHDRTTLERLVGWMHAKLLNRARPLWEFYVFEGLPNNEIGLYSKVHHALIDGGAGAALTEIVYGDGQIAPPPAVKPAAPDALGQVNELFAGYASLWAQPLGLNPSLPTAAAMLGGGVPGFGAAMRDMWLQQLQQPLTFLKGLPDMAKAIGGIASKLAEPGAVGALGDMLAPPCSLNKQISSERSFAAVSVSLSRAKAVAAAAGGKLNDVVLAISSGMLRRHLAKTGALPDKPLKAAVPISLREAGDAAANNQVFGMYCSLASDIEDPKARLAKIVEETKKSKSLADPFKPLVPKLTQFSALGAPMLIQMLSLLYSRSNLADHLPAPANVTISNVPGSRKSLYAAGAELVHIFPVSIATHSLAFNITVQGYRDQLDFGLIAGANVLPELHSLARMLPEELEALERAYGLAPAVTEKPAAEAPAPKKASKARA